MFVQDNVETIEELLSKDVIVSMDLISLDMKSTSDSIEGFLEGNKMLEEVPQVDVQLLLLVVVNGT